MLAPREELKRGFLRVSPDVRHSAAAPSSRSPLMHKGHGYDFFILGDEMRQDRVLMEEPVKSLAAELGVTCMDKN